MPRNDSRFAKNKEAGTRFTVVLEFDMDVIYHSFMVSEQQPAIPNALSEKGMDTVWCTCGSCVFAVGLDVDTGRVRILCPCCGVVSGSLVADKNPKLPAETVKLTSGEAN